MKILVGYIPAAEGVAAFDFAVEQAKLTGAHLTVLNTGKNGDYSDPVYASSADIDAVEADLGKSGLEFEIRRPNDGLSATDSILSVRRGDRGRPARHRAAKAVRGGQADHRQHRAGRLLNSPVPVVCVPAARPKTD
jgi:hypothetical protein